LIPRCCRAATSGNTGALVAWKLAIFQQSILYRAVMLAQGASAAWNATNVLSAVLCGRPFLETISGLPYVLSKVAVHVDKMNLKAISDFLDNEVYSTRIEDWLDDEVATKAKTC
jgi:hypothetical protein